MKNSSQHLLREIVSDTRIKILSMLLSNDMKMSSITKKLKISSPGAQKQLNKLFDLGLIIKNPDSFITLSEKGKIVLELLSNFNFVDEKSEYLQNHNFSFLPPKFLKRIGELQNSQLSKGYVNNIELFKEVVLRSKKYVKHCTSIISPDTYKIAIPHFKKHKVKMSFILAKDMNLPPGFKELQNNVGEIELVQQGLLERRMIDKINSIIWVSEDMNALIFPGLDGELDLNNMLVSSDDSFRGWCSDYFDYLWNQSHGFVNDFVREKQVSVL